MSKEEEFQRIVENVRVLKKNKQQAMCMDQNGRKIFANLAGAESVPDSDWDIVEKAFMQHVLDSVGLPTRSDGQSGQ